MSLEAVIRPFQLGDIFTARVLAPPAALPASPTKPDVLYTFGDDSSSDFTRLSVIGFDVKVDWKETSRTTSVQRVYNVNDSSQYVDVERIDAISFANTKGEKINMTLNN